MDLVVHIPDSVVATLPSENGDLVRDLWRVMRWRAISPVS